MTDRLTRTELSWLLMQEARHAAKKLRSGVGLVSTGLGEPEIRGFAGSLGAVKANKGVFVTTSRFTRSAHDFVVRTPNKIVLIDGDTLASLMIRYGVGVRTEQTILVRKVDEDFFLDE